MKVFERKFLGKISYKKIDKYIGLIIKTIDEDDEIQIEYDLQSDCQLVRVIVSDRILH